MIDLNRYGAAWMIIMNKAAPGSYKQLADRHAAWFAEHQGWQAPVFLSEELQDFQVDDDEEEKDEPGLD